VITLAVASERARKLGLEGDRVEAAGFALSVGALASSICRGSGFGFALRTFSGVPSFLNR
jgi:hypothetical protein